MQLVAQVPQQLLIFCYLDLFAIDKKRQPLQNSLNLNFGSHVTEALFSAFATVIPSFEQEPGRFCASS